MNTQQFDQLSAYAKHQILNEYHDYEAGDEEYLPHLPQFNRKTEESSSLRSD